MRSRREILALFSAAPAALAALFASRRMPAALTGIEFPSSPASLKGDALIANMRSWINKIVTTPDSTPSFILIPESEWHDLGAAMRHSYVLHEYSDPEFDRYFYFKGIKCGISNTSQRKAIWYSEQWLQVA